MIAITSIADIQSPAFLQNIQTVSVERICTQQAEQLVDKICLFFSMLD